MRTLIVLILVILFTTHFAAAQTPEVVAQKPLELGKTVEIKSVILGENRLINLYFPPDYSENKEKSYPVIYLLDGSADEDFIHIAGLAQFASFSWINIIPESIIVGIANVDRKRDFTFPTSNKKDKTEFPTTGGSEKFIAFLEKELQPFITSNYRTTPTKTLIGQSLGGLLATEILLKKPDLFDNYIIVSPSLWWSDEALLQFKPIDYKQPKSIYIAVGKEGDVMENDAKSLFEKLTRSKKEKTTIYFNFLENQNHGDALHLAVYDAFEKIFKSAE
tara:strand:+ start:113152 stop:113979 length:828 start_codon:yes stop_codon:yes gene_type:complete